MADRRLMKLLCAMAFVVTTAAMARADTIQTIRDFDLPGGDFFTLSRASDASGGRIDLGGCKRACLARLDCRAFTFNVEFGKCFLKTHAAAPAYHRGAISGLRSDALSSATEVRGVTTSAAPGAAPSTARVENAPRFSSTAKSDRHEKFEERLQPIVGERTSPAVMRVAQDTAAPRPAMEAESAAGQRETAAPAQPAKPLLETSKLARKMKKQLAEAARITNWVEKRSAQYLRRYDRATAGTKWVKVQGIGFSVPYKLNRSQSQAQVLEKMRLDRKLERQQDVLVRVNKGIDRTFAKLRAKLKPDVAKELEELLGKKLSIGMSFLKIRDRLIAYGDRIRANTSKTWKPPSPPVLRKLHGMAVKMRRQRKAALKSGRAADKALLKALTDPLAAL